MKAGHWTLRPRGDSFGARIRDPRTPCGAGRRWRDASGRSVSPGIRIRGSTRPLCSERDTPGCRRQRWRQPKAGGAGHPRRTRCDPVIQQEAQIPRLEHGCSSVSPSHAGTPALSALSGAASDVTVEAMAVVPWSSDPISERQVWRQPSLQPLQQLRATGGLRVDHLDRRSSSGATRRLKTTPGTTLVGTTARYQWPSDPGWVPHE